MPTLLLFSSLYFLKHHHDYKLTIQLRSQNRYVHVLNVMCVVCTSNLQCSNSAMFYNIWFTSAQLSHDDQKRSRCIIMNAREYVSCIHITYNLFIRHIATEGKIMHQVKSVSISQ